jgi:catechol 2,3-dioxygenase-like lactoylglutathione lyase family enzyme
MGGRTLAGMATLRMDHVSVVVDDLAAATAFFLELGLEPEGEGEQRVEGDWVDRINAIDGVRVDIAMLRTPDGHNRLELTKFHHPAVIKTDPTVVPPNALGLRSVMFEVDDIDEAITRLRRHGGELVGTVEDYETYYRLCYLRGPAGIIVSLAQRID